ncbi:uncharacterized protein LOC111635347 [Centruroides sculpturatus]|uniref:uncharacterized protein LOC111635347 n=1 Tax=Centruroides sculpturatus TaxID=218467 RepID=UPI000C6EAC1A|nr:uncharacterized protein LOC111635347 [Centruroides sculpturatus]
MRFFRKRDNFAKMNAESFQCVYNESYSSFGYDNYVVYAYQYTLFFVPYDLWSEMPEYGPTTDFSQSGILPEYQQYEPQVGEFGYRSQSEFMPYWPSPEIAENERQAETTRYWPLPEIIGDRLQPNEHWSPPEYIGYEEFVDRNEYWQASEYSGYSSQSDRNEYMSAPEVTECGPLPYGNQYSAGPENVEYGEYSNANEYMTPTKNVQYGAYPVINGYWQPPVYSGYGCQSNINEYMSAPEVTECGPQPYGNEYWTSPENVGYGAYSNINEYMPTFSEFQVKDPDQTQKYETHLEQSSSAECNSEKDLKDDKDEKVSENIITNSTSEETSCELDATKQPPIKNVPETPLSQAQITSIVNGDFTLRPLFKAFLDLEENSLVCNVIYEEDVLNYEDDLSETSDDLSYSTESDTMSIEDEVPDTINGNKVSDDCTTYQNIIIVRGHLPVHQTCELVFISPTSSSVYVESDKSDLSTEIII